MREPLRVTLLARAGAAAPLWTRELLAPDAIRKVGAFDPDKVRRLLAKLGGQGDRTRNAV
jgi:hypothetical protein